MSDEEFVIRLKNIEDRFDLIDSIGKGTYGVVSKARDSKTGKIYALKKCIQQQKNSDFSHKTIREVQILQNSKHPNICDIKCVIQLSDPQEGLSLLFEYCEYDLFALISKRYLTIELKKSLMLQLLIALHYFKTQNIIHRDLKPANLFVTKFNMLKIGDFGLARYYDTKIRKYSSQVITSWYRPPELIMSNNKPEEYRFEIDMWSAGCIFYEIVTSEPLFRDKFNTDVTQLTTILKIAGPLPEEMIKKYPEFLNQIKDCKSSGLKAFLKAKFEPFPEFHGLIDLLISMLHYIPKKRISAEEALNHKFFQDMKDQYLPHNLPPLTFPEIHQQDIQQEKEKHIRSGPRNMDHHERLKPPRTTPT